jgi:hypothetical protein
MAKTAGSFISASGQRNFYNGFRQMPVEIANDKLSGRLARTTLSSATNFRINL